MSEINSQKHELYKKAVEFAKNYAKKHPTHQGFSNIYVFRLVDENGNIVDEKFGMNLMTDYGMTQYFTVSGTDWSSVNLYVGRGTASQIDYASSSLIMPYEEAATVVSRSIDYEYPMYYLKPVGGSPGLITCMCKFLNVMYDYTVPNWESVTTISEYGLGSSYTSLWTHSWVYDSQGNRAQIDKRSNTQLFIDVFFCMSYENTLIDNMWTNGKYAVITTMERFFNKPTINSTGIAMAESSLCTFRRYSSPNSRSKGAHSVSVENGVATIISNMADFTLVQSSSLDQDYIDGFASIHSGFKMFEWVSLGQDIQFDLVTRPNPLYISKPDCFSYNFGASNYINFSHCNVQHSYTYNFNTGEYDAEDSAAYIEQTPNKRYADIGMDVSAATQIYFWNNDTIMKLYVYINMSPSDPIVSLAGNVIWVYATDEYWNFDSWHLIEDIEHIPLQYQNAKYWITNTNTVEMQPVRGNPTFQYVDQAQEAETLAFDAGFIISGRQNVCGDYNGKWFVIDNQLYDTNPSSLSVTQVSTSSGFDQTRSLGYGRFVFTICDGTDKAIIRQTDLTTTPKTLTDFTTNMVSVWNSHVTKNNCGAFIFTDCATQTNHEVIRVNGNTTVRTQMSGTFTDIACIENNAQYFAALSGRVLSIYSYTAISGTPSTITIPTDPSDVSSTDPKFIFGFGNNVYVTNGYDVWLVVINSGGTPANPEKCHGDFSRMNDLATSRNTLCTTATTDCLVVYRRTDSTFVYAFAVYSGDTKDIISLAPGGRTSGSSNTIAMNVLSETVYESSLQLWQVNTNTLILHAEIYTYGNWYSEVGYNFGKILRTKSITSDDWVYKKEESLIHWIPYGTHILRLIDTFSSKNLIPHRLTGVTRCVTTYDWPKRINSKSWTLAVTNRSQWHGRPPGTPAGISEE